LTIPRRGPFSFRQGGGEEGEEEKGRKREEKRVTIMERNNENFAGPF
jgi:hypothetical protein